MRNGKIFGLGIPQKFEDLQRQLGIKSRQKVFGIGLQKTGTTTLAQCLQILNYRHIGHYPELHKAYINDHQYNRALQIAKYYDAFEDFPWSLLYQELDDHFPNSKFILTVRQDTDTWLQSYTKWAQRRGPSEGRRYVYGASTPIGYEETYKETYDQWNKQVRDYFKDRPHDFLEVCWEKGDGWEKLCEFLNLQVPDIPFPHENKTDRAF